MPETYQKYSRKVNQCLIDNVRDLCSGTVGLYWPFRGEIDLLPFANKVYEWGGSIALPVVVGKGQPLEFRRWKVGDDLQEGVLGIPFPAHGAKVEPSTFVIPVVAFDREFFRLGYGAGYYDRTLGVAPHRPTAIGVGFELSRVETIYPQAHDVPMDMIVTELGLQRRS